MDIAEVPNDEKDKVQSQVTRFRDLPLSCGGIGVPLMSSQSGHIYAFASANDRMARYLEKVHPSLLQNVIDSRMSGVVSISQIVPVAGFDENKAKRETRFLGGHPLGNIPQTKITRTEQSLQPELTISRAEAMRKYVKIRDQMRYISHTQLMNDLRADHFNNQLVAQSLSSAVVGSGAVFRWIPVPGYTMKCDHFQELLRMRLCLSVLRWQGIKNTPCNCSHQIANLDPDDPHSGRHRHMQRSLQPLHGLCCRKVGCAGRVIRRHQEVCKVLAAELSALSGVQVSEEPRIGRESGMRADLKISRDGKRWYLDVGITNAGTLANVNRGAHEKCAVAADVYFDAKIDKYASVLGGVKTDGLGRKYVDGFIPFVVETGGRIAPRSVEWLDKLTADSPGVRRACYRRISNVLSRTQGPMLSKYKDSVL